MPDNSIGLHFGKCEGCDAFVCDEVSASDPNNLICPGCGGKLDPMTAPGSFMKGRTWESGASKRKGKISEMRTAFRPQHSRDGALARHERIIDHRSDRYFEKVTLCETDEVIHLSEEPLSKHQGHGADKKKRK